MLHLNLAIAPVIFILLYIYYRDKYEKEPLSMLVKAFVVGVGSVLIYYVFLFFFKIINLDLNALVRSDLPFDRILGQFLIGFSEETVKILMFFAFIWGNKNFNEKFDGIVYAVFISLGFAAVENYLYLKQFSDDTLKVAFLRALTSVPAHGFYAVIMGYFLGRAKFENKKIFVLWAWLFASLAHSVYDLIIELVEFTKTQTYIIAFVIYLLFLLTYSLTEMKRLAEQSPFKKDENKDKKTS